MHIKIIVPVAMRGNVQMLHGDTFPAPDHFGQELIDAKEAIEVPNPEHAVMPRPTPTAIPRPQPTRQPKPETRKGQKGRRGR